eukprot:6118024-Amphidinium_carterae.1
MRGKPHLLFKHHFQPIAYTSFLFLSCGVKQSCFRNGGPSRSAHPWRTKPGVLALSTCHSVCEVGEQLIHPISRDAFQSHTVAKWLRNGVSTLCMAIFHVRGV